MAKHTRASTQAACNFIDKGRSLTSRDARRGVSRLISPLAAIAVAALLANASALPAFANGIGSAYVANRDAKELTIVDVESLAGVDVIPTKGQPSSLAIDA